jgi:hypothetical protein
MINSGMLTGLLTQGFYANELKPNETPIETKVESSSLPVVYPLIEDYNTVDELVNLSPGWCMAVFRLGTPITYSRKEKKSVGRVVAGAFERNAEPLILSKEAINVSVSRSVASHTKVLNATIKGNVNLLSASAVLPGDWILGWMHTDETKTKKIIESILKFEPCNNFNDGLKFTGRVHSVRKNVQVGPMKTLDTSYSLQAIGFNELNTQIFYDVAVATAMNVDAKNQISLFMTQIGLNFSDFINKEASQAGNLRDNVNEIFVSLLDAIVGKGIQGADAALKAAYEAAGGGIDSGVVKAGGAQARTTYKDDETPFAYIVPVSVAKILGREVSEKTKENVFGYSDILETIIGVQQFNRNFNKDLTFGEDGSNGFYPIINTDKCGVDSSRKFCQEKIKGTYLPIEGSFVNTPLWSVLHQFLNPSINEMYTCLKPNLRGNIVPTIVVRQRTLSSESIEEKDGFPLTRFMSVPRWKVDPLMVKTFNVGRSDATRFNLVHVYGNPSLFASHDLYDPAKQVLLNPPIADMTDIARSGVRAYMQTINCAIGDLNNADNNMGRHWSEAIADWTIGSHLSLNGTIQCSGIQSPIAEGDNIEFEGMVYQIDNIEDQCGMSGDRKYFNTTLQIVNGMPVDQDTEYKEHFPRYPGFSKTLETNTFDDEVTPSGDDGAITSKDPGRTVE